jgi:transcriptional regulator with XRE-family HTH domain
MLRKLRVGAGLSGAELAKSVGMSGSKISRVETCENGIYLDDVEKLLDFFGVKGKRRVELLDLARNAEQRGWLRVEGPDLPQDWQTWIDFESEASALFSYEPLMMPGLLQTPEYAHAIIRATGSGLSDDRIGVMVGSRMSRTSLLTRSRPLKLHAIIEESVLTRPIGDDEALARQLNHLADSAARPNVTVRVVPTDAGLHPGLNGPFVIMDYDNEASLVLHENKVTSLFLDEQEHIDTYTAAWDELVGLAHDEVASVELIRATARRLSR